MANIYVIGSLRNEQVPNIANKLRKAGHEVFDDWYAAGPEADDYWQTYEKGKGHVYHELFCLRRIPGDRQYREIQNRVRRNGCST